MKALVALTLVLASVAHAEEQVKISQACNEAAKYASEKLENLQPELNKLDKLKFQVVEKRSIAFAAGVGCSQVYFQNYITTVKDGLIDWRKDIAPIDAEIARISDQNFAKYWWVHAQDSWEGLMTLGAGRMPKRLIPETKGAYLASLNEARKEKMDHLNHDKAELQRIILESQRMSMLTGSQVEAEKAAAEMEMNRVIWETQLLVQKERNAAAIHSGCSDAEVKALQMKQFDAEVNGAPWKQKAFDVGAFDNILKHLSESEPLDHTAKRILSGGCQVRDSFYSGERAVLLKGLKLED